MSSIPYNILDLWQFFVLAPISYVSMKIFSLNAKVSVHDAKIQIIEKALEKICIKHDETNNLLRELNGRFEEHFRNK